MDDTIEISEQKGGSELHVHTPGRYAMGIAVEVLKLLDNQPEISVKNTGWKQGFGLEVAAWIPITAQNVDAELQTDGSEFIIRRVSGSQDEFEILIDMICEFLE